MLFKKIKFYLKSEYTEDGDRLIVNGWTVSAIGNQVRATKQNDTILISERNVQQICEFMTKSS